MKGGRDRKVGGVAKARRMRRERRDERVNQYQSSDGAVTIWHVSRMASMAAAGVGGAPCCRACTTISLDSG